MHQICILTFGGLEALVPSTRTTVRFPTRKAAALTAFLAMQRNAHASRDAVAEMLWPGVPPAQARHSLRQTLLEIRHAINSASEGQLGDRLLLTTGDDVALQVSRAFIDVHAFRRCVDRQTARAMAFACSLYRGDFLAGLHTREPTFDLWVTGQRTRLHLLAVETYERRIECLIQREQLAKALQTALRLLELDPFHESAHRTVLSVYARRGDISAAKRHYDALVSLLKEGLDIEPAQQTQELLRTILQSRGSRWRAG